MKVLVIEGSTRFPSSTLAHVEALLKTQGPAVSAQIVRLADTPLPLFTDARGFGAWQTNPQLEDLLDQLLSCDCLVLASPLYWYSVSTPMKNFIDHWSYFGRQARAGDFLKGKTIFPLIVASEGATEDETKPVFDMLRLSAEYVEARILPGFLGEGDRAATASAESLQRIARIDLQKLVQSGILT
jgi:multimeric flavodoxin WrbA